MVAHHGVLQNWGTVNPDPKLTQTIGFFPSTARRRTCTPASRRREQSSPPKSPSPPPRQRVLWDGLDPDRKFPKEAPRKKKRKKRIVGSLKSTAWKIPPCACEQVKNRRGEGWRAGAGGDPSCLSSWWRQNSHQTETNPPFFPQADFFSAPSSQLQRSKVVPLPPSTQFGLSVECCATGGEIKKNRGGKKKKSLWVRNKIAETTKDPKDAQVSVLLVPTHSPRSPIANEQEKR